MIEKEGKTKKENWRRNGEREKEGEYTSLFLKKRKGFAQEETRKEADGKEVGAIQKKKKKREKIEVLWYRATYLQIQG